MFLKKVNFMENRDYFFYKRKVMVDNGMGNGIENRYQEREEAESTELENRRTR